MKLITTPTRRRVVILNWVQIGLLRGANSFVFEKFHSWQELARLINPNKCPPDKTAL
jgi:hypothetical protein